jgi:acylphosphatase
MQNEMSNAEELSSATIRVRGSVQGVDFRTFTGESARNLGLTGFAQNLPGGMVKVFAEGRRASVQQLIDYLHIGPTMANVQEVNIEWSDPTGNFSDFTIKR